MFIGLEKIKLEKKCQNFLVLILALCLVGCGSGTNNDQGTSFLAYGFFSSVDDGTTLVPTSSADVILFRDVSPTGTDGLSLTRFIGIENRLTKQFIRLVRADCDYNVTGSLVRIPSDVIAMSRVIDAAPDPDGEAAPGAGTDGEISPDANVFASRIDILSPDIFSFINNNKSSFPELPFRMTVTCSVTGITQAGDVLTTNPLNYFIQFRDESECCTGAPDFQQGPGTGGDLTEATEDEA